MTQAVIDDGAVRRKPRTGVSRLFLAAFLLAFCAVVVAGALWVVGVTSPSALRLRLSEPYHLATSLAARHPLVVEHLGAIESYGPPSGQLDGAGGVGWCELKLWVHGSRADGLLEVRLDRRSGQWFWGWANLRLDDGQLITLDTP